MRRLWTELRGERHSFGRGAVTRPLVILVVGLLLCAGFSFGMTRLAQWAAPRGLDDWDRRMVQGFAERGPMSFPEAILAESPGNLSYLIPLTLVAAVIAILLRRAPVGLAILIAYWGVRPLVLLGWWTWDRARPTLIADGIAAPPLHSFPSGHAALTVAVYGLLAYLWIQKSRSRIEQVLAVLLAVAWVAMISLARVRLGSHWMSDIIAGAVLGGAWLAVVIIALRSCERRRLVPSPGTPGEG